MEEFMGPMDFLDPQVDDTDYEMVVEGNDKLQNCPIQWTVNESVAEASRWQDSDYHYFCGHGSS